MTPARWNQVLDVFNATLERHVEDRTAYLDEACAHDAELRDEVESLLEAYDEDPAYLEQPAVDLSSLPDGTKEAPFAEHHVGPYRVIRRLGEGGMGTVHLAVRDDDQFRKYVALKLVRRGMDSVEILRRFRHERQILASLDHPNIARLLDGGMTDDGRPYLVMEYIQGVPIHEYCDAHRLRIADRLALFRDVCQAVHYAHQNLVVHRDLKPSNILVSEQGEVKLLDFGIAKLLDPDLVPHSVAVTEPGLRLMTPEYASPEQVRGDTITTASDVYALGVLLYELLTGHRPYRLASRMQEEVARVICEEEPERPSTAVGRVVEDAARDGTPRRITPETVSEARSTRLERLRRVLTGDLDNIVLMAMRKEPRRRYASVEQLAEDVRRYRDGLPVLAQKDTFTYRAGKFVRRHRAMVAATALVVGLVFTFGAVTAVQSARIRAQADQIARERDRSEQVSEFLASLFRVADPEVAQGDTVSARTLLDRGVAQIDDELQGQPDVQAEMLRVMGEVYLSLGLFDRAEALLQRSVDLRRAGPPEARVDLAKSLVSMVGLLRQQGRHDEAEPLAREAVERQRADGTRDDEAVAMALYNLGQIVRNRGDYDEAEALFREALARRLRRFGPDHAYVIHTRNSLALVLQDQGRADAAESLFVDILAHRRRLLGSRHSDVAQSLNNLGLLLYARGRYAEAEAYLREALAIRRDVYGDQHPSTATVYNNLGLVLSKRDDYDGAETAFRGALAILRAKHGDGHPRIAATLSNLADVHAGRGDLDEAERLQREALAIRRALMGDEHPAVAKGMVRLATLLERHGREAEAEALYRDALVLNRRLLGDRHPDVATNLNNLGVLLAHRGDSATAEALYREALAINEEVWGTGHPAVLTNRLNLAGLLGGRGAYAEAERLLLDAHAALVVEDHPGRRAAADALVALYEAWGRPEKAQPFR